ncbi:MAG: hypothetical protein ACOCUD_03310 [Bacillota bacterium]
MNLLTIYEAVNKIINQIDFSSLWPNFKKYDFALYNDEFVIINGEKITKTDEFTGNTAIKYEGNFIAIWYLQNSLDEKILVSKLIHEMFHAFQYEQNEKRFPDELDALFNYENSLDLLQLKYYESITLLELDNNFTSFNFKEFLNIRAYRKKQYPYQYEYESKIEVVEGMAQFVELKALGQIDENLYLKQYNKLKERIKNINNYFPIRIISYDIGTLLIKVMLDNDIDVNQKINSNAFLLDKQLKAFVIKDLCYPSEKKVTEAYKKDIAKLNGIIASGTKNYKDKIIGEFNLKFLNVYDARYYKGYIYSKYFVMIEEKGLLLGDFLLKTDKFKVTEIYKL